MSAFQNDPIHSTPPHSAFVTALAWIFIVLATGAVLMSLLQIVIIGFLFPGDEMRATVQQAGKDQAMPLFAAFMFENFRLLVALFFVLSVSTLVSAIGLLKRRNWARLTFITIMALGILQNLASMILPFFMFSPLLPVPGSATAEFHEQFDHVMKVMIGYSVLTGIAFSVLFVWIIRRLLSEEIRREFVL